MRARMARTKQAKRDCQRRSIVSTTSIPRDRMTDKMSNQADR